MKTRKSKHLHAAIQYAMSGAALCTLLHGGGGR